MSNIIQLKKKCIYHDFTAHLLNEDAINSVKCKKCGYVANDKERIRFLMDYVSNHFELLLTCIDKNLIELDRDDIFNINLKSRCLVERMKDKMKYFIEY